MPSSQNKRGGKAGGKATAVGQGSASGSGPGKGNGPEPKHQKLTESCVICLLPFNEPAITKCGHIFCYKCLEQLVSMSSTFPRCPLCRGSL